MSLTTLSAHQRAHQSYSKSPCLLRDKNAEIEETNFPPDNNSNYCILICNSMETLPLHFYTTVNLYTTVSKYKKYGLLNRIAGKIMNLSFLVVDTLFWSNRSIWFEQYSSVPTCTSSTLQNHQTVTFQPDTLQPVLRWKFHWKVYLHVMLGRKISICRWMFQRITEPKVWKAKRQRIFITKYRFRHAVNTTFIFLTSYSTI